MLLTSAPVAARSVATPAMPLDLHVLSLSLAFILSQDQTLRCIYDVSSSFKEIKFEAHVPQRVVVSHGPGSSAEFIKYRYL